MSKIVGFDVGTMNLVSAVPVKDGKVEIDSLRNMFLKIDPNDLDTNEAQSSNWDYVEETENGKTKSIYIIGEDTFRFANIFGKTVNRPMSNGVISVNEIDSQDVLVLMVEKLIGKTNNGTCVYSVPAQSVDTDIPPVSYHETVWKNIFQTLGYKNAIPLNEAQSIIYSECKDSGFTGISFSFGCGLTNIACCYKGTPTLKFSVCRGGDWIDQQSSISLGINVVTRVTRLKEKSLDLSNLSSTNKKEKQIKGALGHFYEQLIEHVLYVFKEQFNSISEGVEIDESIPIVLSGGTSMVPGFKEKFETVFNRIQDFPYDISEIRMSSDPMNAVAKGCLIYGIWKDNKTKTKGDKNG